MAEIITPETFQIMYAPFLEVMGTYFGLEPYVDNTSPDRKLTLQAENHCRKLHCTLRDLSSLLQGLGRLAEHFIAENFVERFANAQELIDR